MISPILCPVVFMSSKDNFFFRFFVLFVSYSISLDMILKFVMYTFFYFRSSNLAACNRFLFRAQRGRRPRFRANVPKVNKLVRSARVWNEKMKKKFWGPDDRRTKSDTCHYRNSRNFLTFLIILEKWWIFKMLLYFGCLTVVIIFLSFLEFLIKFYDKTRIDIFFVSQF